ncbi:hypothetical protein Efla_003496 [Eimeria flavescens]
MATNDGAAERLLPQHDQQQHWGIGAAAGGAAAAAEASAAAATDSSSKGPGPESEGHPPGSVAEGLSSGILPCRKRKATEELPQIDEATAERLRRATDSLTKEQLRMLLARACSHYPAVENALYALIEADPSSRRLMIRNVPYSTTETSLRQTLEAHGPIEDFKLVIDRNTGRSHLPAAAGAAAALSFSFSAAVASPVVSFSLAAGADALPPPCAAVVGAAAVPPPLSAIAAAAAALPPALAAATSAAAAVAGGDRLLRFLSLFRLRLNKGFAFVTYKSMEDVANVLQTEVSVDGRPLSIKLASQQDQGAAMKRAFLGPNQGCRLFVRNVPDTCDERRLKQEFESFGIVKETAIVRNRDGSSKGYGFVVFEDPEALMKAASQAQRVIDGQVTFVSVASESRRQQQLSGGGVLPPQHLQQLPLGTNAHYQQQLQQQLLQQQAVASQWPAAAASAARSDVSSTSPYGNQAVLNSAATAAAALPAASAAAATNPYMQQITAALMPQLYMHHYQQQYLASTQANAAAAGAATSLTGSQQQQQQQKLSHLQHLQQQ